MVGKIKILIGIGIEDSIFSYNAAQFVVRRPWRPGTLLRLPDGFEISVFARGLGNPRMLAVGRDGAVYVTRREQTL